ncbi:MAG: short-chain dehydrogenase [Gemmatimonadetes bacterium]|nr:MAG: short-chain dehydrogenase [Gemmatimonadota bacterium]
MKVTGTLALVTGASSGIGAATARELAREGARVLLLARTRAALDRVAREITDAGGSAKVHTVDLADAPAVQQAASAIKAESGTPDILVNSAGAGRPLFTEETSPAEAAQMTAVPYLGAFNLTSAFLPDMIRRRRGHIVNVSSVAAFFAVPGMTGYTAARWAMRGFTEALRQDLHGTGVGVTLVAPGLVSGTGYYEHNPGTAERVPKAARFYPTLTTQQLAAAIVRGIERNKREVGMGLRYRLTALLWAVLPWPVNWVMRKTGWKRATSR